MDIPQLIASYRGSGNSSLLETLIKSPPIKKKDEDKNLLNVFMDFNIDTDSIDFNIIPYGNQSEYKYYYFGNNPAAAKQIYAVRDVGSLLNYWIGRPSGIMKNILDSLKDGALKELLNECFKKELFNENGINLKKIKYYDSNNNEEIYLDRKAKALYLEDKKLSPEKFINMCVDGGPNSKIILIIPRIIKDNKDIIISTHEDYIEIISNSLQGKKSGSKGVCHICGLEKDNINTKEYSSKLSRSSIGKVFVTKTVNYAPLFKSKNHQNNYGICKDCYAKLKIGEKRIMSDFKLKIANEDCILLFEGIDHPIDIEYINEAKDRVDIIFNPKGTKEWAEGFKKEINKYQNINLYQFNMVFYKTDGKSCSIKKTIENISNIRFEYVINVFKKVSVTFEELKSQFTLGHIYKIVPVSVAKDGTQLNIHRVLDLYSAIIKGEMIDRRFIFDLAVEALGRGLNQLNSSQVRNYKNLDSLVFLHSKEYGKDVFIKRIMMSYIALFEVLQELKILDKEVFCVEDKVVSEELSEEVKKAEEFTNIHGFSNEAKGLFYLGLLMNKVGYAQYKQGHKDRPILDKISYDGMTNKDVMTLYLDLLEKIRQYKKHINIWACEQIEKQFHRYMGNLEKVKLFSEKENIFFIMSGYAFGVNAYKKEDKIDNKEEEKND